MNPLRQFNPDQFNLCFGVYASALLDIQYETGRSNNNPPSSAICLGVALRIIEAFAYGERDVTRLKQFGLQESMERQKIC